MLSFLTHTAVFLCFSTLVSLAHSNEPPVPFPTSPKGIRIKATGEIPRRTVLPGPSRHQLKGTIHHFNTTPRQLGLLVGPGKGTILFTYHTATTYEDLAGKAMEPSLLMPETPVVVAFTQGHNQLVAERIVVQRIQVPLPGGGVILTTGEMLKTEAAGTGGPPLHGGLPAGDAPVRPGGLRVTSRH